MGDTPEERIAVLETQHKALAKNQDKILKKLEDLEGTMKKYHGFIGGIVFVINALWIAGMGIFAVLNRHG